MVVSGTANEGDLLCLYSTSSSVGCLGVTGGPGHLPRCVKGWINRCIENNDVSKRGICLINLRPTQQL
jgi:hypothetical protein